MKKRIFLFFIVVLSFFFTRSVFAKDTVNISIKDIEVLEKNNIDIEDNLEFDGLELKSNVTFYDVGDYIKYKVTLKNNDNKDYQIKDIIDDNTNSSMSYEYDIKDKLIKKNSEISFTIKITYSEHITNDITKLTNNTYSENKDVKILIQLANNSILNPISNFVNPATGRNILLVILVGFIFVVGLNMAIKNKKVKTMLLVFFLLLSTKVVKASEIITVDLTLKQPDKVKINFMDRNWKNIDSGADFTKIEFVKIDKDKSGAYDISEAKDRSIIEWVENGTLYIGSYHNVYAPVDSSLLFSRYTVVPQNWLPPSTTQSNRLASVTELKFNDRLMTNYVTNMEGMFICLGMSATTFNIDLSNWDVSNVTNMEWMFDGAGENATTWNIGNLSNWDVSNVTDMSYMFIGAGENATTWSVGDLSNWDVSNVTNMMWMFTDAGWKATTFNIDLSNWDVSNVTDMSYMFASAGTYATTFNIDLSNWDVSNVTDMSYMFAGAGRDATTFNIDLSNWDVSNVTDMSYMFASAGENATTWSVGDLSNWDVSKVTDMDNMFAYTGFNATTWSVGDLSNWDTSKVTDMYNMFASAGYNATTWNSIGTLNVYATNVSYMFNGNSKASATLNIHNNPTYYESAFNNAATASGSGITVNYTSDVTNIDDIIATKSSNSNVFKGNVIS